MADQSLEAFQLGASLYDRAQTQKRMMEQLQVQTAESLLQRQGMELQNKIREDTLAESIGERKAQVDEYNTFSTLGKQVSDYLNNPKPDAVFPVVPPFKSKTYRAEADKMLNNLEKYSARAELLKARDRAENTSNVLKASTINKAVDAGAWIGFNQDGSPNIDVPKMNAFYEKVGSAKIGQTEAKTTSLIGNLELAKNNLNRLVKEGGDKNAIAEATLNYKKALAEESSSLNREKFDFNKGVQLEKLANERIKANQLVKRTDAYVQKITQPIKDGEIKLNTVDDRLVKKYADDIAIKQGVSDAIGYEIKILEDSSSDEFVRKASAQNILNVLNSTEGKNAVQESERKALGQFLEFQINPLRFGSTGRAFGTDLPRFIQQISIKKEEIDTRVNDGMERVNSIYKKYGKSTPAGTYQTPSKGLLMTAPAPQAMRSTNAPSMSSTNAPSVSRIPFKTLQEAKAAGVVPGTKVLINGVPGTIQ